MLTLHDYMKNCGNKIYMCLRSSGYDYKQSTQVHAAVGHLTITYML